MDGALEAPLRVAQRIFGELLFVNILDRAGHRQRLARGVAFDRCRAGGYQRYSPEAVLIRISISSDSLLSPVAMEHGLRQCQIIGVDERTELAVEIRQFAFRVAEQRVEAG